MRNLKLFVVPALAALWSACVPALNPLYTVHELVFDPAMVGTWTEKNGKGTWVVNKSGDKAYEVVHTGAGAPAKFDMHLAQLEGQLFVDFYPAEPDIKDEFYKGHLIRAHSYGKISVGADSVKIAMLDPEWVKSQASRKRLKIGFENLKEGLVLTESNTEKLREFIIKCAADQKCFGNPVELRRQP